MTNNTIWIHYTRPRPHWYRLPQEEKSEKQALWDGITKNAVAEGAVSLGDYHIRGQHDFQTVSVWRFPSPEAAFEHWSRLTAAGYNEWHAFTNNIGLALDSVT